MITNSDNTQLIKTAKLFMILTGLYKGLDAKHPLINRIYFIYSKFSIGFYYLFVLLLLIELIRLIIFDYDFIVISSSFGVFITAIRIIIKVAIYLKNKINDVIDEVIQEEEKIWQSNDDEVKQVYNDKVKLSRIFGVLQFTTTLCCIIAFSINGIQSFRDISEYNRINNATLESHEWYQTWLPFNAVDHLLFASCLQILFTFQSLNYNSVVFILFSTLMISGAARLEVLQVKLRKFVTVKSFEEGCNDKENIAKLKTLIKEHQNHIQFVEHLNQCTRYIVLLEFVLSSMDVASASLLALKFELFEISKVVFHLVYISMMLWQIFSLSWTCNEIIIQSVNISDSLYESQWHLLNKEGRLLVQVMMIRAQRPLEITIGPFGAMTLGTGLMLILLLSCLSNAAQYWLILDIFSQILKGAYSYISLMN